MGGEALVLTLSDLVERGRISGKLAIQILDQFDTSVYEALGNHTNARLTLKGQLHNYNNLQNVWLFCVKDVKMKVEAGKANIDRETYEVMVNEMKITCIDKNIMEIVKD